MATHAKKPLIQVSQETKDRLDKIGSKGDTYDTIIVRLLDQISHTIYYDGSGRARQTLGKASAEKKSG